jgi:hypothetical protein
VANLAGQLSEPTRTGFLESLGTEIEVLDEEYCQSATASAHPYFCRCGLTDSAMVQIAKNKYLVVTDDFRLAGLMSAQGIDVINFNHIRQSYLLRV